MKPILCNLRCYNRQAQELFNKDVPSWRRFVFDIHKVEAAKDFDWNDDDEQQRPSTILYMNGNDFIVDIPFNVLLDHLNK